MILKFKITVFPGTRWEFVLLDAYDELPNDVYPIHTDKPYNAYGAINYPCNCDKRNIVQPYHWNLGKVDLETLDGR